jgi:hypothetical protein
MKFSSPVRTVLPVGVVARQAGGQKAAPLPENDPPPKRRQYACLPAGHGLIFDGCPMRKALDERSLFIGHFCNKYLAKK